MEEFHNAHESHEPHEPHGAHSILVNPQKLSQGLTRTFEGISIIFASLGSKLDVTDLNGQVTQIAEEKATATETGTVTAKEATVEPIKSTESVEKAEKSTQSEQTETSEQAQSPEPATASKPTEQAEQVEQVEPSEPTKSSMTLDDITKVIVEKIKQDRGNRERIEAIVHEYGVSVISQLDEANYEAFLAELASL